MCFIFSSGLLFIYEKKESGQKQSFCPSSDGYLCVIIAVTVSKYFCQVSKDMHLSIALKNSLAVSCGVGRRRSLDPALLWLWRRLAATALIRPLA